MIYCIGRKDRYEAALAAPTPPVKKGGGGDYPGGWVWATAFDAGRFIAQNGLAATHAVYGLLADWQADTAVVNGQSWRRLTRDAGIVRLPIKE